MTVAAIGNCVANEFHLHDHSDSSHLTLCSPVEINLAMQIYVHRRERFLCRLIDGIGDKEYCAMSQSDFYFGVV